MQLVVPMPAQLQLQVHLVLTDMLGLLDLGEVRLAEVPRQRALEKLHLHVKAGARERSVEAAFRSFVANESAADHH